MITPHISFPWNTFLLRVVVPTLLTIILFTSVFLYVIIPTIRNNGIERKKEMIKELTTTAWNVIAKYHNDELKGTLTREQAQKEVIEQIKNMHYGQQSKDYFWINDMTPRMIIHPYRNDLYGKDLSNYTDLDGKKVFIEIVKVVSQSGSGFVTYKWQENDNSALIIPKISYVKVFAPWGWVIGTGIYIEDIETEITQLIKNGVAAAIVICTFNSLILIWIISVSYLKHKKEREAALELETIKSSLALSEKMASLGTLSAMVAHEINNPLSGILSYAKLSSRYLLKENLTDSTIDIVNNNLSIIASEAKRCGEIVKNLLLFAKQSQGKVSKVHLNDIIILSTKVIDHSAKMKELELIAELDSGDDTICCDPGTIQQILVSLIVNAMESSSQGKRIIVRTDYSMAESIQILVIDHGHGIAENDLPFIFDPFFSTKDSNSSLGLGLSAVYGIVHQHSGTIQVESQLGAGTTFTIILPREYNENPHK
jgi:signal transduction histidine kinase